MKHRPAILCALFLFLLPAGCSPDEGVMHNGYYSARADSFAPDGWKEFLTLYVHNDRIVTVEYNARNASGLVMSWDVRYLSRMKAALGMHPNQIIRDYIKELLNRQDPGIIRRVSGDTRFYDAFATLSSVAVAQAKKGDKTVLEVPVHRTATDVR